MSALDRVLAEFRAASRAFLRRRTAVFFTFVFPLLIVIIFGALVETGAGGGGLFAREAVFYVPGYLAVVVLFTPLSRVGSEVARHRDGNRFEKLATTPLTRTEWLVGQTLVNVGVVGLAAALVLVVMVLATGAAIPWSVSTVLALVAFVVAGVVCFCGGGALIGSVADSQDGVIAAANGTALPLVFLSETFVAADRLPDWLPLWASPLTYFSRGVRAAVTATGEGAAGGLAGLDPVASNLLVLSVVAVVAVAVGATALPRTD